MLFIIYLYFNTIFCSDTLERNKA